MRRKPLLVLWLLSDLILFLKVFALSYFLRVGQWHSTDFPFEPYIVVAAVVAPLWLSSLLFTRTFSITRNQWNAKSMAYVCYSWVLGTALFSLAFYFTYGSFFSRMILVLVTGIGIPSTILWHGIVQFGIRCILRGNPPEFPTLIIGANRDAEKLIDLLNANRNPLMPIAILDGRGSKEKEIAGVPVIGKLNLLNETLDEQNITHVIQCSDLEQTINILSACKKRRIHYMLLPTLLGMVEGTGAIEPLEGIPVVPVGPRKWIGEWFFR